MKEIIPGIQWLQLPLPVSGLDYVNIYLVQGDDGYLLVDSGWNTNDAFNSLEKQLTDNGIDFKDISQIVVSHIHPDHYGLAGRIKQLSQAKMFIHHLEENLVEPRYINMGGLLAQLEHWLQSNGVITEELPRLQTASLGMEKYVTSGLPDTKLYGGETISTGRFTFEVVWTPGHSPGHICLYEPAQKILISGDHILPTITPNVGLHPQSSKNPLGDYLDSLAEIKELDVDLVLPGHENPFTGLQLRIEEIIQHHKLRSLEILRTAVAEPKTAYEISTEITWMSGKKSAGWQNLAPLNKRFAVLETIAHLELMRADGKVKRLRKNGTTYYQST